MSISSAYFTIGNLENRHDVKALKRELDKLAGSSPQRAHAWWIGPDGAWWSAYKTDREWAPSLQTKTRIEDVSCAAKKAARLKEDEQRQSAARGDGLYYPMSHL